MGWRGPVSVVALGVLGLALGYAGSTQAREATHGSGVPEPVAATGPRLPVDDPTPMAPDPEDAALQPGLEMTTGTLGSGKFRITYPVPQGWRTNARASNEAKWKKPGTANNTYVMRIEQITSQNVSITQAVDTRITRLGEEQEGFEPIDRGADSLEYTYVSDEGNARHSFMRWIDTDNDGEADVEIVVHGRERDVPGTRDLIDRVATGVRAG